MGKLLNITMTVVHRNGEGTPTSYYRVKGDYVSLIKFSKAEVLYYTYKGQQLNPQPDPNEILIIKRYYLKLKANNDYERRITRILAAPPGLISNIQYAVVEYKGEFPGHRSHGLTTMTDSIYLRTPSSIMHNIGELSKNKLSLQERSTRLQHIFFQQ